MYWKGDCMKIDLHCHTLKVKSGDPDTRNVSVDVFAKKVANADVKIVAITNHNKFDYEQYKLLKNRVEGYCDVWPGIELDAYGDVTKKNKPVKFHIIIVANPDNVEEFSVVVDNMLNGKDVNSFSVHINEICSCFKNQNVLYIPHYMGKTPAIPDDDLELLKELVGDETRVFTETTESSIGVLVNHDYHALVGSDVKDWQNYEDSMFSDLRLPVSTFEQFCLLSKRDKVVIDTILNKKTSYEYYAKPHSEVSVKLKLFEDINIIFGQKGTGKSEIVSSLYEGFLNDGFKCVKYVGTQKEDGFKKIINTSDMKRDSGILNVATCEEDFIFLTEWTEPSITLFSTYIKWFKTRNDNTNKKRMKITEAIDLTPIKEGEYIEFVNDRKTFTDVKKNIKTIKLEKYLSNNEIKDFDSLIFKIDEAMSNCVISEFIKIKAIIMTNYSVNIIKQIADKKTDTVSKPSTTGFYEYAKRHIGIKRSVNKILESLNATPYYKDDKIGELEGKGNVYVRSLYRMLCSESTTKEFRVGIKDLKAIRKSLIEVRSIFYKYDISAKLEEILTLIRQNNINSVDDFIGVSKMVVDNDKHSYEPSTGEKGILLLQQTIKEEADVYFFDEPELGMGNSYIDATIRPQISELGKRHKVVIIATHNANLAVRTLPYMSIFRKYENGIYYTYVGNPFRNELVNIDDENDLLNWTYESMHTLEGGKAAFYERKDIYESGN